MPKILIVDDDPICHTHLAKILVHEGYEVRSTADPNEAVAVGATFKPDLLITDFLLRNSKDGLDVTRALCTSSPGLRVFMITGLPGYQVEERLAAWPGVRLFEKPLDLDGLLEEIRTSLGAAAAPSPSGP